MFGYNKVPCFVICILWSRAVCVCVLNKNLTTQTHTHTLTQIFLLFTVLYRVEGGVVRLTSLLGPTYIQPGLYLYYAV